MRRIGIVLGLVCLGLLIFGGVYWYKQHSLRSILEVTDEERKDLAETKKLLEEKKPKEALALIKKNRKSIEYTKPTTDEWIKLFIGAAAELGDTPQLIMLYEHSPQEFSNNEKAAIVVSESLILSGRGDDYKTLREKWKGREQTPQAWLILDADALLLENKRSEAIELLKSKQFEGSKDTGRLVRLALLYVLEQPKTAWNYLSEAFKKDPHSPDVRSYRAKLLESIGKPALALSEYRAAISTMPNNLFLRDQLAEFYVRNKQFPEALKVWIGGFELPNSGPLWIKAFFWSKVAIPVDFDWKKLPIPEGHEKPLIEYLIALKPDQFWDQEAFSKIEGNQRYLKSEQITFWLRVIQALKSNNEKEADDLLHANLFSHTSFNLDLENALKQIENYRRSGNLTFDSAASIEVEGKKKTPAQEKQPLIQGKHPFFTELSNLTKTATFQPSQSKMPDPYHNLIKGPFAYASAFTAAFWYNAGIALLTEKVVPEDYPDWVVTDLIAAMKEAKGVDAALVFAKEQKQTPAVQLLIGELYVANRKLDEAVKQLTPLLKDKSDTASTAAFFIALIHLDQGEFAKAKTFILQNSVLFKEVTEKELLARIAIINNDISEATKLYTSIQDQSNEAKSFLARQAFEAKNWDEAQKYTEELIKLYPENPVLRDNYEKILREKKLHPTPSSPSEPVKNESQ